MPPSPLALLPPCPRRRLPPPKQQYKQRPRERFSQKSCVKRWFTARTGKDSMKTSPNNRRITTIN